MKLTGKLFLFFILLLNLVSCTEEVQTLPYMGYEYFPDSVGHYVVYHVDSIWVDDVFNRRDTYDFGLKEVIESKIQDNEERPTQRIERYKDFSSAPYTFDDISDVWFATRTTTRAEKVEENIRYVKLIFPVQNNVEWNGNAFNTEEDYNIDYKFLNVHKPFTDTLTGITFDSTVTVLQIDWQPVFDYRIKIIEVYAKNIGLVYKYYYKVRFQTFGNPPDTVLYGAQYKYHYLEHGYE